MNIFPLRKAVSTEALPPILPHSLWVMKPVGDDPFPPKDNAVQTMVRETLDGWVRFQVGSGIAFPDERMEEASFRRIYQPYVKPAHERAMPEGGWQ